MNCDRIAPFYQLFERAAFGGKLQNHRVAFVEAASGKRRALILGDGDGRFTQALSNSFPDLSIDSVEMSAVMVSEARKRVPQTNKVRVIESDLFQFAFTGEKYDIAFSHFFLDCFDTQEAGSLVRLVSPHLTQQAVWIVSDFRQLKKGWRKLYAGACLKTMYLFFRLAAGLETRQLPDYDSALEAAGFARRREQLSMAGFIASEWWQR